MQHTLITAQDIMTTGLVTVSPTEDVLDGIDRLLRHGISGAPVIAASKEFLGTFSEKSSMAAFDVIDSERRRRCDKTFHHVRAGDFMTRDLMTVSPETDAVDAIGILLRNHVSGLPVVSKGEFVGSFSEHSAMKVIIDLTWNQISDGPVSAWMDRDRDRVITENTPLEEVRERFRDTVYRRLPVVNHGRLAGQISRRDVLRVQLDELIDSYGNNIGTMKLSELSEPGQRMKWTIEHFMATGAKHISPDTPLMTIAQQFFSSSGRRLPVVENGQLLGQVSRRDLLSSVRHFFADEQPPVQQPLYLSSTSRNVTAVRS